MAVTLKLDVSVSYPSDSSATITVKVKAKSTQGSYNGYSPSGSVTINGKKQTFSHSFGKNTTTTLATKTQSVTRTTASQTIKISAKFATGVSSGTISASATATVAAKPKYTVTWNANYSGGTNSSTAVFSGGTTTFPNMTRIGYSLRWGTTSTGGTTYSVGATTPAVTAARTYYAIWTPNTYDVIFNANGGTAGATTTLKRTFNAALAIPDTARPTRQYFNFLGWATSSTATVPEYTTQYPASTLTSTVTLYAVWELAFVPPSFDISKVIPRRTPDQDSTDMIIPVTWANGKNADQTAAQVTSVKYEYKESSSQTWTVLATHTISSGTADSLTTSGGKFSTGASYDIRITLADANASVYYITFISKSSFIWKAQPNGGNFIFGVPVVIPNMLMELDASGDDASLYNAIKALGCNSGNSAIDLKKWIAKVTAKIS